jgi:DNA-binding NarL/FixJ family response regulator
MNHAIDRRLHVLVADHDGLARRMMQTALQEAPGILMVTAARDAKEALELALYYRPAVLLVELALPPGGGVDVVHEVLQAAPELLIVTVSAGERDDQSVLAALRGGAVGHIDKDVDPDQLARLVCMAADGEAIVPRRLIKAMLGLWRRVPDAGWRPLHSSLTTREWQIVELLRDGASTGDIANSLVLSPTTVYSHINSMLRKLGVHCRRDAVAAAECLRREEVLMEKILT